MTTSTKGQSIDLHCLSLIELMAASDQFSHKGWTIRYGRHGVGVLMFFGSCNMPDKVLSALRSIGFFGRIKLVQALRRRDVETLRAELGGE